MNSEGRAFPDAEGCRAYCDAAAKTPAEACGTVDAPHACEQLVQGLKARTRYSVRVTAANTYVERPSALACLLYTSDAADE